MRADPFLSSLHLLLPLSLCILRRRSERRFTAALQKVPTFCCWCSRCLCCRSSLSLLAVLDCCRSSACRFCSQATGVNQRSLFTDLLTIRELFFSRIELHTCSVSLFFWAWSTFSLATDDVSDSMSF